MELLPEQAEWKASVEAVKEKAVSPFSFIFLFFFFNFSISMQYRHSVEFCWLLPGKGRRTFSTQFLIPSEKVFQATCMDFIFHLYFLLKFHPLEVPSSRNSISTVMVTFVLLSKIQRRLLGSEEKGLEIVQGVAQLGCDPRLQTAFSLWNLRITWVCCTARCEILPALALGLLQKILWVKKNLFGVSQSHVEGLGTSPSWLLGYLNLCHSIL